MPLSFTPRNQRTQRWQRDLAEYRRLLAKQITAKRETPQQRWDYYRRLERINVLYRRLY